VVNNTPFVSILIPTLNEQSFIQPCIQSLLEGNYPLDNIEVLVIDGGSTDNTQQEVIELTDRYPSIQLLQNEKKIVPAAMNIGISESSHDILIWAGAHAVYDADYVKHSVDILTTEKCASVGGVIQPIAKTFIGCAIAAATSSKFGIGNAKYRYATSRQTVDTVFGGCWFKSDILEIGGFNENWVRNQDYELNCRLRDQIGPILLDPSIRCKYFCRETIRQLARQYFNYGYWRFHTSRKHPGSFTIRQAAPLVLALGLLVSCLLVFNFPFLASLTPIVYLICAITAAASIAFKHKRLSYVLVVPVIFATLHLTWSAGFFKAALLSRRHK